MIDDTRIATLEKHLPPTINLTVDSDRQRLAMALVDTIKDKRCRYHDNGGKDEYQIPEGVMIELMGADWEKNFAEAGIRVQKGNEPVMLRRRVYFDKPACDAFIAGSFPEALAAIDNAFSTARLLSPAQLAELKAANGDESGKTLRVTREKLHQVLGHTAWPAILQTSAVVFSKAEQGKDSVIAIDSLKAVEALHHETAVTLIEDATRNAPQQKNTPAPAPAKEPQTQKTLTPDMAVLLLKAGDRETNVNVVERLKAGVRSETKLADTQLVLTFPLLAPAGGEDVSDNRKRAALEKFLADNGISMERFRDSGFTGNKKLAFKLVAGDQVECTVPMADMEEIAGVSWEQANPHFKNVGRGESSGRS